MKRFVFLLFIAFSVVVPARGQQPLYIVNGIERSDIRDIDPEVIEQMEELPADEFTIARYGEKAANGVVLITLKYDTPARFTADTVSFARFVARQIKWSDSDPTARVVLRYRIAEDGSLTILETLQSTDPRLKRRVEKIVEASPRWEPARKAGKAVATEGVLRLQLPEGKPLPRQLELVIR